MNLLRLLALASLPLTIYGWAIPPRSASSPMITSSATLHNERLSPLHQSASVAPYAPTEAPTTHQHHHFEQLHSLNDFLDVLDCSELVVVVYHAHYCKVCQRTLLAYNKLAHLYPDTRFVSFEASRVKNVRLLGLTQFPFGQVYHNGDCVASLSIGGSQRQRRWADTVHECVLRTESTWDEVHDQYAAEIAENRQGREVLRK